MKVLFPLALWALITLDFNALLFGDRPLSNGRAWTVLGLSVVVISVACYALTWAVVVVADQLGVPLYFSAVVLAAAATSVPDTVISVKDAIAGHYDDAISNAIGSNIFDICVALGLPLLVYGLAFGDVSLTSEFGASADVQELQLALLIITIGLLLIFVIGRKTGRGKALALAGLYVGWLAFIGMRAVERHGML